MTTLSRLKDILHEISSNLGPLEQEAKDAAKVRELKNKLKQLEVLYFLHQTETASAQRDKARKHLEKIAAELAAKEEELRSVNADYNAAMNDSMNSDIYGARLRDQITELLVSNEKAAGEYRLLNERLANPPQGSAKHSDRNCTAGVAPCRKAPRAGRKGCGV